SDVCSSDLIHYGDGFLVACERFRVPFCNKIFRSQVKPSVAIVGVVVELLPKQAHITIETGFVLSRRFQVSIMMQDDLTGADKFPALDDARCNILVNATTVLKTLILAKQPHGGADQQCGARCVSQVVVYLNS